MVPDADSRSGRPTPAPSGRPAPAPNPFRQVLVGWDGSPGSVAALRTAAAIVGEGPGRVIALAVLSRAPHLEQEPGPAGTGADGGHARQTFEVTRSAIAATVPARISLHTEEGRDAARSASALRRVGDHRLPVRG
jgi:hypothetical protein